MVNDANHETVIKKVSVHNSEQIQSNKFAEIFRVYFKSVVLVYLRLFLAYIPIIRIRRAMGARDTLTVGAALWSIVAIRGLPFLHLILKKKLFYLFF